MLAMVVGDALRVTEVPHCSSKARLRFLLRRVMEDDEDEGDEAKSRAEKSHSAPSMARGAGARWACLAILWTLYGSKMLVFSVGLVEFMPPRMRGECGGPGHPLFRAPFLFRPREARDFFAF